MSDKFWAKVERRSDDECWGWNGATTHNGYGCLNIDGRYWRAHRYSWTLHNGPIPKGRVVMHSCDTRDCTNPEHLRIGTQRENIQDQIDKGRWLCGEDAGRAKLTEQQVRMMRRSNLPHTHFAKLFSVHPSTIYSARIGRKWSSVE